MENFCAELVELIHTDNESKSPSSSGSFWHQLESNKAGSLSNQNQVTLFVVLSKKRERSPCKFRGNLDQRAVFDAQARTCLSTQKIQEYLFNICISLAVSNVSTWPDSDSAQRLLEQRPSRPTLLRHSKRQCEPQGPPFAQRMKWKLEIQKFKNSD